MKKISFWGTLLLACMALGLIFLDASCHKDPCRYVRCSNNGTCNNGSCSCPAGYEGSYCQILSRDKAVGGYTVNESCSASGTSVYNATISAATDNTQALLYNINKRFANPVVAQANGNSLTINDQIPDLNGIHISGSGTISADTRTITFSYSISGAATDGCNSSVWTR